MADVKRLTNANIWIDGASQLGRFQECETPEIVSKMSEHKALGMIGDLELPSGFEKMEGTFKWASFYAPALGQFSSVYDTHKVQVRGSVEGYDSTGRISQLPVVWFMTIQFKNFPSGKFVSNDNAEFDTKYSCTYLRVEQSGVPILEIDVMAQIYSVNAVDQMATYRSNLGI